MDPRTGGTRSSGNTANTAPVAPAGTTTGTRFSSGGAESKKGPAPLASFDEISVLSLDISSPVGAAVTSTTNTSNTASNTATSGIDTNTAEYHEPRGGKFLDFFPRLE